MYRLIKKDLENWRNRSDRKPLIVRGARQVGKTYSIYEFGKQQFENLLVFDFEKTPALCKIFEGDLTAGELVKQLEIFAGERILPGETLVFFDEIQACPRALLSLRYFYEEMPELHIIGAGSLLEFALEHIPFPVGRVEFLWMRPMGFREFLKATGDELLAESLPSLSSPFRISEAVHEKLIEKLKQYFIVGGMPEAVKQYVRSNSLQEAARVHATLLETFLHSLLKYRKVIDIGSLQFLVENIPGAIGKQIQYRKLDPDRRIEKTKNSLQILEKSRLISMIYSVKGMGLPLGSSISFKKFKLQFLDIGLLQHFSGMSSREILTSVNLMETYRGALVEQFVGQELLLNRQGSESNRLFYWSRDKRNSSAEVDFLLVKENQIYPVEVKSGPAGKLRSLHLFLDEHPDSPSGLVLSTAYHQEQRIERLRFMPIYTQLI